MRGETSSPRRSEPQRARPGAPVHSATTDSAPVPPRWASSASLLVQRALSLDPSPARNEEVRHRPASMPIPTLRAPRARPHSASACCTPAHRPPPPPQLRQPPIHRRSPATRRCPPLPSRPPTASFRSLLRLLPPAHPRRHSARRKSARTDDSNRAGRRCSRRPPVDSHGASRKPLPRRRRRNDERAPSSSLTPNDCRFRRRPPTPSSLVGRPRFLERRAMSPP